MFGIRAWMRPVVGSIRTISSASGRENQTEPAPKAMSPAWAWSFAFAPIANGVATPVPLSTRTIRGAPRSVNHRAPGLNVNPRSWATGIAYDRTTAWETGSIWSIDFGSARTCQKKPSAKVDDADSAT